MITIERVAENLFDKIRARFDDVSLGTEEMKKTLDPTKARFFSFKFSAPDEDNIVADYGRITISLVDTQSLKVFYDQEIEKDMPESVKQHWYKFIQSLRKFSKRNMLDSFDVRDIAKASMELKDLKHLAKDADVFTTDEVMESRNTMTGTSRSSYQVLETAKIIVRHNKKLKENELGELPRSARSTNISAILIENESGERFKLPQGTTINEARVIARHVRNEGTIHDPFGQHLMEMLNEMHQLKTFVRNMRGRTFEDRETQAMLESAQDHWGETHSNFFAMRTQAGYQRFRESWEPRDPNILTDEVDVDSMRSRFERRVFDERLEGALPIVARAHQQRKSRVEEEFGNWMESVIQESYKRMKEDVDPHAPQDSQSPLSMVGRETIGVDDSDNSIDDEDLGDIKKILNDQNFTFAFSNGKYEFQSSEERERALDWMAKKNVECDEDNFVVKSYDPQPFGNSTNDSSIRNDIAMESLKKLAGIR